jgi:hypothetical protein
MRNLFWELLNAVIQINLLSSFHFEEVKIRSRELMNEIYPTVKTKNKNKTPFF